MSKGPANFRQSDLARALRAARQAGLSRVLVRPDGTIEIPIAGVEPAPDPAETGMDSLVEREPLVF